MSGSRIVYKYRIYCTTDSKYEYAWLPSTDPAPTTCPINSGHSIDPQHTLIVDEVVQDQVVLKEETVATQGFYLSTGNELTIDGNLDSFTTTSHSWPFQVTLLTGWFYSTEDHVGDKVSVTAAPNTITGAIVGLVSPSDTVIPVTQTVIDNTAIGFHIDLTDGVNLSNMGRVLEIDAGNSTITLETGSTHTFNPLSPTYVRQSVSIIEDMFITTGNVRYAFAEKKQGGKAVPPNIPIQICYHNRTGGTKKFAYNIEIMY